MKGYYQADKTLLAETMRPSATFNAVLASIYLAIYLKHTPTLLGAFVHYPLVCSYKLKGNAQKKCTKKCTKIVIKIL